MAARTYTLSGFLQQAAERFPDQPAILFGERRITYAELDELANRFGAGLLRLGIRKGDRVGLYMTNHPEWVITFFGIARMGGVIVPMNTRYRSQEVAYILNNCGAAGLIMGSRFAKSDYVEIVESVWDSIPTLANVIVHGETKSERMLFFDDALRLGADYGSDPEVLAAMRSQRPEDVVFILYTSGTTGSPKGAMLTNLNIAKNGEQIAQVMQQSERDATLIVVPFFHCFGCVIGLTASVSAASAILPQPVFEVQAALRAIEQHRATVVHGVPTMFIEYLEEMKRRHYDVQSVRTGVMAGAPCPVEVMKGTYDILGANIVIAYGLTEASPVITMTHLDDRLEDRVETVGRALPEQEVRVVDDARQSLPANATGELAVRGYNVMQGYYDSPAATAETIDRDGWLYSGDLATMDERGYVRIVGRKKEMYITGGFNVYPREIEEFLFSHPRIENVAVVGIPDPKFGEIGLAVVKLAAGTQATEEEILAFCRSRIANFKVPKRVVFVDQFPMTQSGKIQKFRLREMAENGSLARS
jgi:fatty-acyl-CoA synthase